MKTSQAVGKLKILVWAMLQKKKARECIYNKKSKWVQTKKMYIPKGISQQTNLPRKIAMVKKLMFIKYR